jgi:hypothetical protein
LVVSQPLTLLTTPVIYLALDALWPSHRVQQPVALAQSHGPDAKRAGMASLIGCDVRSVPALRFRDFS